MRRLLKKIGEALKAWNKRRKLWSLEQGSHILDMEAEAERAKF